MKDRASTDEGKGGRSAKRKRLAVAAPIVAGVIAGALFGLRALELWTHRPRSEQVPTAGLLYLGSLFLCGGLLLLNGRLWRSMHSGTFLSRRDLFGGPSTGRSSPWLEVLRGVQAGWLTARNASATRPRSSDGGPWRRSSLARQSLATHCSARIPCADQRRSGTLVGVDDLCVTLPRNAGPSARVGVRTGPKGLNPGGLRAPTPTAGVGYGRVSRARSYRCACNYRLSASENASGKWRFFTRTSRMSKSDGPLAKPPP